MALASEPKELISRTVSEKWENGLSSYLLQVALHSKAETYHVVHTGAKFEVL